MAEPARLSFDRGTLLLRGRDNANATGGLLDGVWQWHDRVGAWRCEAIHYSEARDALRAELGESFVDDVREPLRVNWPDVRLPELRPEQRGALDAWRSAGRRGLVVMPTGTGKTEVALAAMAETRGATIVRDLGSSESAGPRGQTGSPAWRYKAIRLIAEASERCYLPARCFRARWDGE